MIKEILEEVKLDEGISKDLEREINNVLQTVAPDAQGAGIDVADSAIDSFSSYADDSVMKEWNAMKYSEKSKIVSKLAKQYV